MNGRLPKIFAVKEVCYKMSPEIIDALVKIVRAAGRKEVMPRFRRLSQSEISTKSSPVDLVTVADKASENLITNAIQEQFPDWFVIGEEATADDPKILQLLDKDGICAIIDPIDGTWNFAHGISEFGIILAVVEDGITIAGILYDPVHDDWIYATKGGGAHFCASTGEQRQLSVVTSELKPENGLVPLYIFDGQELDRIFQASKTLGPFVHLPSCPAYRQLAFGHFQFSFNKDLRPWDHAAGILIMEELGAYCKTIDGRHYTPSMEPNRMLIAQSQQQWNYIANTLGSVDVHFQD